MAFTGRELRSTLKDDGTLTLALETVLHLQQLEPQRPVQAEIAPGLRTRGDRQLLKVALENLLGNVHIGGKLLPAVVAAASAQSSGRTNPAGSAAVPAGCAS